MSSVELSETAKTQALVKWHAANVDEAGVHATALCDQSFTCYAAEGSDAFAGR